MSDMNLVGDIIHFDVDYGCHISVMLQFFRHKRFLDNILKQNGY